MSTANAPSDTPNAHVQSVKRQLLTLQSHVQCSGRAVSIVSSIIDLVNLKSLASHVLCAVAPVARRHDVPDLLPDVGAVPRDVRARGDPAPVRREARRVLRHVDALDRRQHGRRTDRSRQRAIPRAAGANGRVRGGAAAQFSRARPDPEVGQRAGDSRRLHVRRRRQSSCFHWPCRYGNQLDDTHTIEAELVMWEADACLLFSSGSIHQHRRHNISGSARLGSPRRSAPLCAAACALLSVSLFERYCILYIRRMTINAQLHIA